METQVVGSRGELADVIGVPYAVVPMEGEETKNNPWALFAMFLLGAVVASGVYTIAGYELIK